MDFFDTCLYLALVVLAAGTIRRVLGWFRNRIARQEPADSWARLAHALRGAVRNVFSFSIFRSAWTFIFEVLLLGRTARKSLWRWIAHCLIFYGFMGLLLFHAMDGVITERFFPDYVSTLDPWQLLRNLFGLMVLTGLLKALARRIADSRLTRVTEFQDWGMIAMVLIIILSGFFLEASKIVSPVVFQRMVDEYMASDDEGELTALKAYWSANNGVVFSEPLPLDSGTLEQGREVDDYYCLSCHSDPRSAFGSWTLARFASPALNARGTDRAFWYVHVLFSFLALALMPWGKFFHPLSTPVNLVLRQGRRESGAGEASGPEAKTRAAVGLDACTRCGECSLHCSVAPSFAVLGNRNILPSEKLSFLRSVAGGGKHSTKRMYAFAEGSRICTECLRCTEICPSGIDLQELWMDSKIELVCSGLAGPNMDMRARVVSHWLRDIEGLPDASTLKLGLTANFNSFRGCVQCTTCTSVCPVVAVSEDPTRDLDLAPQQIMNLLRMGLVDQALGARMVWSCTTCYKCQEHCPQEVPVADVLYELRNIAAARLRRRSAMSDEGGGE